ncbi:hypothetical protein Moror_5767 [Moniliophthora roreri MCA 2997]|uniref:Uncharacterized protein n=1 Tax=Moniliophthora roreri (strain MCA 2997) TaxID=1381753 RepID=V2X3C2_MONRO|nr:hypothetical protein Moror_5767 [Moniliophthora roreri MCA 2997]
MAAGMNSSICDYRGEGCTRFSLMKYHLLSSTSDASPAVLERRMTSRVDCLRLPFQLHLELSLSRVRNQAAMTCHSPFQLCLPLAYSLTYTDIQSHPAVVLSTLHCCSAGLSKLA